MVAVKPPAGKTPKRRAASGAAARKPTVRRAAVAKAKPPAAAPAAPPVAAEPPPTSSRRRVAAAAAGLTIIVAGASTVLMFKDRGSQRPPSLQAGVPAEVSAAALRAVGGTLGHSVYWIGPVDGTKLELTETNAGYIYVRYLPRPAVVGDKRPAFTTIATFPMPRAFARATSASRRPNMESRHVRGGAVVVWSPSRPTSVYYASPTSDTLVEVYDPDPVRARTLATSSVRPVQ